MSKADARRDDRGLYTHAMERVCRCGRTKGQHLAMPPYECPARGVDGDDGLPECDGFRAVRKPRRP